MNSSKRALKELFLAMVKENREDIPKDTNLNVIRDEISGSVGYDY